MNNPTKIILIFFVCLAVFLTIEAKFLGAYVETPVEKQGYCKMLYGEEFRLTKDKNECYAYRGGVKIKHPFTEENFKNWCPKPNFISTNFWNICFKFNNGDTIS